ncbi:ArsR/SmtB family transcription factor [Cerasicoccus fimbriatus]|uniref:ArsR/SmtB family transcription factor n=1 Tax=Cerasicoccus fimbriatus TaxID=3014554 RepID=UPI0022B3E7EC|nr:metalloregulator ArsR/SmtB family transcription factor [Cerasicoccus sp. TK19100]
MPSWDTLKLLADPTRLRLIQLLRQEELSVAELQELLDMGQSRISSHLALLRQGGLLTDRKEGKKTFYSLSEAIGETTMRLVDACYEAAQEEPEFAEDEKNLERVLDRRRRASEEYFNQVAGRLGRNYCPGRSWEAIGHFLLHLTPHINIADLGAGEGVLSQLLAQRAKTVYCIDNSPRMVEVGTELAAKNNIDNLYYKLGDIENVPLENESIELALLSQALHHAEKPAKAIAEAHRILKPGGKLVILDLKEHQFEKARELYADRWLGFPENTLYHWLKDAGFGGVKVNVVSREEGDPGFETVMASGEKAD